MVDFSPFCFFVLFSFLFFFILVGEGKWGGGGGLKSNYYTNRLKLQLSIPKIVDDYPSNGTKYSSL